MVRRIDNGKYRIKINLKDIQKRKTFYGTRMEAEHEEDLWKNELLRKRDGLKAPVLTVDDAMDYFMENHAVKTKPKTYRCTKSNLARFKRDFGTYNARELTKEMMATYFNNLLNLRYDSEKQVKLSASAKHKYIIIVRQAFEFAIKNGRLQENPVKYVDLPHLELTRDRILNDNEWRRLYAELRDHLKPVTLFAYQVPCRISELRELRRDKVDTKLGIVYLDTSKNGSGRIMPIPDNLKQYFDAIPPESPWAFFRTTINKETGEKNYLPLGDIKTSFNKAKKRAGVEWVHFHDLRHSSVSSMASNGIRQEVIMKVAGMKTPSIFHRYRTINLPEIIDSVSFYKNLSLDKPKENPIQLESNPQLNPQG